MLQYAERKHDPGRCNHAEDIISRESLRGRMATRLSSSAEMNKRQKRALLKRSRRSSGRSSPLSGIEALQAALRMLIQGGALGESEETLRLSDRSLRHGSHYSRSAVQCVPDSPQLSAKLDRREFPDLHPEALDSLFRETFKFPPPPSRASMTQAEARFPSIPGALRIPIKNTPVFKGEAISFPFVRFRHDWRPVSLSFGCIHRSENRSPESTKASREMIQYRFSLIQ